MWLVGLLVKTDTFEIHNALDGKFGTLLHMCSHSDPVQVQSVQHES